MSITIPERINQLITVHGSLQEVARRHNLDPGYLCKMRAGGKMHPSDGTLFKLGLKRVEYFELRIPPKENAR